MTNPVGLPPYALAPTIPSIGSASFSIDVQNFFAWQVGAATGANVVGLAQSCVTNATAAYEAAQDAKAAAAGANVNLWDAVTVYSVGVVVKSPAALAAGAANVTYVCKAATGATHIDPYSDPTRWAIFTVSGGVGGAVYTTSTTLTSASPFAISISGSAGVWLKLPDATTMSKGVAFNVKNNGDNDLRILNSAGDCIGFIRSQCGSFIGLSDNATAAGVWIGDFEQYGITAQCSVLPSITNISTIKAALPIDSDRTLYILGGDSGSGLYGFVYNYSTGVLGDSVLIRAACNFANAILTSGTQALCVSCDAGTSLQASVFTINGTAISSITISSATLGYACNGIGKIIQVGSAFIASFGSSSNGILRAVTISAGSASIGAEQSMSSSEPPRLFSSGSIIRVVFSTGSSVYVKPFSISGNTLTAGTQASVSSVSAATDYRSILLDTGNIFIMHFQSGACVASVSRLSGMIEAITNTTLYTMGAGWANPDLRYFDFEVTSGGKVFVSGSSFDTGTPLTCTLWCNIFNDAGSTQSVGTAWSNYIGNAAGGSANIFAIKSSGVFGVGFYGYYQSNYYSAFFSFDTSGTSPVLSKKISSQFTSGYIPPIIPDKKDIFGRLNGAACRLKNGIASIGCVNTSNTHGAIRYSLDGWSAMEKIAASNISAPSLRGASDYVCHGTTKSSVTGGLTVFTIETAKA